MQNIIEASSAAGSLREAILVRLSEYAHPKDGECTGFDLCDLEEEFEGSVDDEIVELIWERLAYITEPLSRADRASAIFPVTWEIGRSTIGDIEDRFGAPHARRDEGASTVVIYDLYVEDVEEGYPLPPLSYAEREADNEDRPEGCNFPFTGIWPPEALQAVFVFGKSGVLLDFQFSVGTRVT